MKRINKNRRSLRDSGKPMHVYVSVPVLVIAAAIRSWAALAEDHRQIRTDPRKLLSQRQQRTKFDQKSEYENLI